MLNFQKTNPGGSNDARVNKAYEIGVAFDTRQWKRGVEEKTYEVKFNTDNSGLYKKNLRILCFRKTDRQINVDMLVRIHWCEYIGVDTSV